MTLRIAIILMGLLLCFGCNKSTTDPRIAQLEAEIKKLKSGDESLDAAKKATRELKKINSVIEMGVNYANYTKTLLDAKPAFDEAMENISDEKLKMALKTTMQAFIDAEKFWNICITKQANDEGWIYFSPEQQNQFKVYKLQWKFYPNVWEGYLAGNQSMIQEIWKFANISLALSEQLSKQNETK